tara:strand:+ start:2542 stop:3768 length:1227 start_codon:yes stop_codon:yes gene_type:complete
MSEPQEEIKLKRITIKTETGSKWFDDPDKLKAWVQQQLKLWNFHNNEAHRYGLQNIITSFENSWGQLFKLINNGLKNYVNDPEQYETHVINWVKTFQSHLENKKIFTDEAPYFPFLDKQSKISPVFGLAVIAIEFDVNVGPIDRNMYEGLKQADAYFAGNFEKVLNESESLNQLHKRWDEELANQRDSWVNEYQTKIDEATRQNQKVDGLISDWQEQTDTQSADLDTHKHEFKKRFDDELDAARTELENLTKTYDDKLALHAAVRYWGIQLKSHNEKAKSFGWALGITTISVLAVIIIFSIFGLDKPFKEVAVSRLVTAAALTTFGIWVIKIVANIFMSHLHLATDAQERRTMIHTYLALTRKGQGPKEEDRQLILQTLFRPSTTDMVKNDQGPTQLVDLINRLSAKN